MEFHALFMLLVATLASVNARIITDELSHNDIAMENSEDADVLLQREDRAYDSDYFNGWVDKLFDDFANNDHVNTHEGVSILSEVAHTLLDGVASARVETVFADALVHQCGTRDYAASYAQYMEMFIEKDACIRKLEDSLNFLVQSDKEMTIRNQVSSQLLCKVLPQLSSCFEPLLKAVLECTDDASAAMTSFHTFKHMLMEKYCQHSGEHAADLLVDAPQSCISFGVQNFIKFSGPAFLKKVLVPSISEYPCKINQYLTQAASVLLQMNCGATELSKAITSYHQDFASTLACHRMYW